VGGRFGLQPTDSVRFVTIWEVGAMELFEAIRGRASIGKVEPDPIDRALVEQLLEAATWGIPICLFPRAAGVRIS
jgi:hypothetical protein